MALTNNQKLLDYDMLPHWQAVISARRELEAAEEALSNAERNYKTCVAAATVHNVEELTFSRVSCNSRQPFHVYWDRECVFCGCAEDS